jgi:hypothetical protein
MHGSPPTAPSRTDLASPTLPIAFGCALRGRGWSLISAKPGPKAHASLANKVRK